MGASPYPLPRSPRITAVMTGDGVNATYGPFSFKIVDEEDVTAWTKAAGQDRFTETAVTVEKVIGLEFDHFTVTFAAPLALTTEYVVAGTRIPLREFAIANGGFLDTSQLEAELSRLALVMQEARRDIDRAVKADPGSEPWYLEGGTTGQVAIWDAEERKLKGGVVQAGLGVVTPYMSGLLAAVDTKAELRTEVGFSDVTPIAHNAVGGLIDASPASLPLETTALQAMIDAAPAGALVNLMGRSWKAANLTLSKLLMFVNGRIVLTAATGTMFSIAAAGELHASRVTFEGPGNRATYVGDHKIIGQTGTSSAARSKGPRLSGCTIKGSGSYGVWAQFCDGIVIEDTNVSDCAYAAEMYLSCNDGQKRGGKTDMLGAVGTASNAYAFSLTLDQVGHNLDPNAGTPLAANPFCRGWLVTGVTTYGPQIWSALDQHGGFGNRFLANNCYACAIGIAMSGGSNDAANYAGYDNIAAFNVIDARMPDGSASGVVPLYGIIASGGSAVNAQANIVIGNTITGFKNNGTNVQSIRINTYSNKFVCAHNRIRDWDNSAIVVSTGSLSGVIEGNVTSTMARAAIASDEVISIDGASAARIMFNSHIHEDGANQPLVGLRVGGAFTGKIYVGGHGMDNLATPVSTPNNVCHGPGFVGTVAVTGVTGLLTGVTAPDLSLADLCPGIPVRLQFSGLTGAVSIDTTMKMKNGGQVRIVNNDANTVTVVRAGGMALPGAVDAVLTQYDEIQLSRQAQTGSQQWRAATPVVANG